MRYNAVLIIEGEARAAASFPSISDNGARIDVETVDELPDRFTLLLSSVVRRRAIAGSSGDSRRKSASISDGGCRPMSCLARALMDEDFPAEAPTPRRPRNTVAIPKSREAPPVQDDASPALNQQGRTRPAGLPTATRSRRAPTKVQSSVTSPGVPAFNDLAAGAGQPWCRSGRNAWRRSHIRGHLRARLLPDRLAAASRR